MRVAQNNHLIKPRHRANRRRIGLALAVAATFPAHAATDLTQLSLEQLLQVTVVSASKYEQKQSEVAAAVSVITRDEIRTYGWRTLGEALASLPGIYISYDRQYGWLGTRGFSLPGDYNTRFLVAINGNRVNDVTYDGGPSGRMLPLDLDLIERIEFVPGPGGAVYGQNAMFGVVNIVTRSGGEVAGTELAAAYQRPQATRQGRASWGRLLDNGVEVLLSASGLRSRGDDLFFDYGAAGVSGVAQGLDGERDKEFFARVSRGVWAFDFAYGDRRKDDPTGTYLSDPLVPGGYQADRYVLTQLQYQDSFADGTLQLAARLFAGQHRYRSTLFYETPFLFPAGSDWRGGEFRLVSTKIAGHKLMLGLEAQDNARYEQAALDVADPANDFRVSRSGYRAGLYAQDEWHVSEHLLATIGLRVDRNNVTGTELSPRAALIWQAAASSTIKALYGRAHRAPNSFERDYDDGLALVGNPQLKGETIDTVELVGDHRISRNLAVRGSIYRWTMRDLITLGIDPVSGLPQYQSGEKINAKGVELSVDNTWDGGGRLRGSVSMQRVSLPGDDKLLNSPQLLAKLNVSAPLRAAGLRLGYELQYDSKRRSLDGSDLGGYALSNLVVSADTWAKGLDVSIGVYNLLDKRYSHPGADTNWQNALEQDGRSVRLKVSYKL